MALLARAASAWALFLTAGLWACLAATRRHFRGRSQPAPEPLLPMTVIKPMRGWDAALEEGLRALVDGDPGGALQILVAVESAADPACAAARAFAAAHPGRDIEVLVTGPAGPRMGKIHNMIEALPRARHPVVVFSDADAWAGPALLQETSRAFREGDEAAYALPVHPRSRAWGDLCHQLAFQHFFVLPAALSASALRYPFCAGAWMAFSRDLLERMGGLLPFSRAIADDFALSRRAWSLGARSRQLRETVLVQESGTGAGEALEHLAKWAAIIRWCLPGLYFPAPLLSPTLAALAAWGLGGSPALIAGAAASRVLVAVLQDEAMGAPRLPWAGYGLLPLADLGSVLVWLSGLRSSIAWRGTRYRLTPGGQAEVVGSA